MKKSILLTVFLFTVLLGKSQNQCKDALFTANQHYESGQINKAVEILESCASKISPKESKFEAYKLLALSHQNLGNTEEMDKYIKLILKERPYYQNYPNGDPASFTKEVQKFKVTANRLGGIKVGTNINNIKLVESFSALEEEQSYKPDIGYQVGVFAIQHLAPSLYMELDLNIGRATVHHEIIKEQNWEKKYNENLNFYQLRLSINKAIKLHDKLNFTAGINAGAIYLRKALISVKSNNLNPGTFVVETKDGIEERNKLQPNIGAQIGLDYQLDRGRFGFEIGFLSFLTNTVNSSKRLEDLEVLKTRSHTGDKWPVL